MFNSLKSLPASLGLGVIALTLVLLPGCSWVNRQINSHLGEECKTHAYIENHLLDHITARYGDRSQARLGIVPFDVPANLAGWNGRTEWGYELAVALHQQLLATGEIPIVQVLNRRDWPGKKEEFDSGNFGAISQARDAGFDLVLVGRVEPFRSTQDLVVTTKIIETESSLSIWYGRTEVFGYREDIQMTDAYLNLERRRPDYIFSRFLQDEFASCLASYLVVLP